MGILLFLVFVLVVGWFLAAALSKQNPPKRPKTIGYPTKRATGITVGGDDDYQQWLTKAVKHKKDNDFEQAIEYLDKAYRICASYPLETVFDHYLRLPAYLQAAGRSDEGWAELNKLNIGVCPYRGDSPTGSERDIRKAYKVSDKMRAFLDKEKKYKESLVHRVVAAYLSAANVAQMVSDGWVKKEREKEFSVETLTVEFDKAVKKAKLEEPLGGKLATYINTLLKEGSKDLYVLSRVPEVMMEARSLLGESYPSPDVTYEITIGGEENDDDVLPPPLGDQYLEFNNLDVITTDEDGRRYRGLRPSDLKSRAEYHANVISPPDEWRLRRNREGLLVVDGDWKFILDAKSEEEWQLYVYSIKNYPDLLKIGIAKDAVKRKESYYKKKLHLLNMPKREAIMVEHLFKHATYHHANNNPPKWNVGNIDEENLIAEIIEFSQDNYEGSGLSEVRKMTLQQAKNTLSEICSAVQGQFLDDAIEQFGIKTYDLQQVTEGRSSVEIPHLRWQLRPYPYQVPKKRNIDYSEERYKEFSKQLIESLKESDEERYQKMLAEYEQLTKECWTITSKS